MVGLWVAHYSTFELHSDIFLQYYSSRWRVQELVIPAFSVWPSSQKESQGYTKILVEPYEDDEEFRMLVYRKCFKVTVESLFDWKFSRIVTMDECFLETLFPVDAYLVPHNTQMEKYDCFS